MEPLELRVEEAEASVLAIKRSEGGMFEVVCANDSVGILDADVARTMPNGTAKLATLRAKEEAAARAAAQLQVLLGAPEAVEGPSAPRTAALGQGAGGAEPRDQKPSELDVLVDVEMAPLPRTPAESVLDDAERTPCQSRQTWEFWRMPRRTSCPRCRVQ